MALTNTAATFFSDSPTYLSLISLGLIWIILALLVFASARQSMVFPVPGGPYKRIPPIASEAKTPDLK
jgi:hypothetical protein